MYAVSSHIQQNNIYSMCSRVFANALRLDVLIFVVVVAISGVPLQYVYFFTFFVRQSMLLLSSQQIFAYNAIVAEEKKIVILRAEHISVFTFVWWDFIPFYLSHSLDKHDDNKESTNTPHNKAHFGCDRERGCEKMLKRYSALWGQKKNIMFTQHIIPYCNHRKCWISFVSMEARTKDDNDSSLAHIQCRSL